MKTKLFLLCTLFLVLVVGCRKDNESPQTFKKVSGSINIQGISTEGLVVVSFTGIDTVHDNSFQVDMDTMTSAQTLYVQNEDGNPVMIYRGRLTNGVVPTIDVNSTAIGLVTLHPVLGPIVDKSYDTLRTFIQSCSAFPTLCTEVAQSIQERRSLTDSTNIALWTAVEDVVDELLTPLRDSLETHYQKAFSSLEKILFDCLEMDIQVQGDKIVMRTISTSPSYYGTYTTPTHHVYNTSVKTREDYSIWGTIKSGVMNFFDGYFYGEPTVIQMEESGLYEINLAWNNPAGINDLSQHLVSEILSTIGVPGYIKAMANTLVANVGNLIVSELENGTTPDKYKLKAMVNLIFREVQNWLYEQILTVEFGSRLAAQEAMKCYKDFLKNFGMVKGATNVGLRLGAAFSAQPTINFSVTNYNPASTAELIDGEHFGYEIPSSATYVRFEYYSNVSSGTRLSTLTSPTPIYGNLVGDYWVVSTAASTIFANTDCSHMFENKRHLLSIDFGTGFNTSNVTNMEKMFIGCESLTSLNLSYFITTNVTNMGIMFANCYNLTTLDISSFHTSNVKDMMSMFYGCRSLSSLDLSSFNTSNVRNMDGMFYGCRSLSSLDLSSFNTSQVRSMDFMFYECCSLSSLDLSTFNTSNVTSMGAMFQYCNNLTSLDLSSFNTSNVTSMGGMFVMCENLTSLDLSSFSTSNVRYMDFMFYGCERQTSINLSSFNTSNVTSMESMFSYCYNIPTLDLFFFNTSNVTNMRSMFSGCLNLTNLDLYYFDMSNVLDKRDMCFALATQSQACIITCPTAVRIQLESGTNLPTDGVNFTWMTY